MGEVAINFNCPHCGKSVSVTLLGDVVLGGFKITPPGRRKIKKVRVFVGGRKVWESGAPRGA